MLTCYRTGVLWALFLTLCGPAFAQPQPVPDTLFYQNFEDGELAGWAPMGQNAKLSVTRETQHVKEGKAALRFDYAVAKEQMNAMLITGNGPVPAMAAVKSFRFWIKTDYATPIVMVLQEQGGGRYIYLFSTPKDVWQRVEVAPSEFFLSDGADDPKDADNKLDMEQVEAIALADFSQLFAQNEEVTNLMNVRTGAHSFYVDDLVVSTQAVSTQARADEGDMAGTVAGQLSLDAFPYPQPSWLSTGGVGLSVVVDEGLKGRALKAVYRHSPDKFVAVVRRLPRGKLAETQWLSFNVASLKPVTLVVQVEEQGGGKYNATLTVPGDVQAHDAKLEWKNFTPADDSKDNNNRLDLDEVHQLLILDATGFLEIADGPNTLWLSRLRSGPVKQANP